MRAAFERAGHPAGLPNTGKGEATLRPSRPVQTPSVAPHVHRPAAPAKPPIPSALKAPHCSGSEQPRASHTFTAPAASKADNTMGKGQRGRSGVAHIAMPPVAPHPTLSKQRHATKRSKSLSQGSAAPPRQTLKYPSVGRLPEVKVSTPRRADTERADARRLLSLRLATLAARTDARARSAAETCRPTRADFVELEQRLAAGLESSTFEWGTGRPLEVVLGVDFGTTSTKIVARLPYEAGAPTFAVPAPVFARAEEHPYLWASRLWLAPDGMFSLCPLPHAAVACAIKANLMASVPATVAVLTAMAAEANSEEVAAAFLALQLLQARGWLASERAALFKRQKVTWSYNFGFPAASLNDDMLRKRYECCTAAALALASARVPITLSTVRSALGAFASSAALELEQAQAALVPEIAAAVSGFANSTRLDDGLYALVDVGGGTVDCCTFNLFKSGDGGARCPIFAANVQMLGVEPWSVCQHDSPLAKEFRQQLNEQQWGVIWRTKKERYQTSERWISGLPLFFVGGGIESSLHRDSTHGLNDWLRKFNSKGGGVRITPLPPPEGLDHGLCDAALVHRLAVAIGLSLPVTDIPDVELPGAIEDVPTGRRPGTDGNYVGKEQT
jgi:hypothetical protein